jgi:hypothetical protein
LECRVHSTSIKAAKLFQTKGIRHARENRQNRGLDPLIDRSRQAGHIHSKKHVEGGGGHEHDINININSRRAAASSRDQPARQA